MSKKKVTKRQLHAICGPSGSGKSWFAQRYLDTVVVSTDDFYLGKSQMKSDGNGHYNFDTPEAVDLAECREVLRQLVTLPVCEKVKIPIYEMKISERVGMREVMVPGPDAIIVVEGIFSFHLFTKGTEADIVDFRIWMATSWAVVIARRIRRDCEERGRTLESVLNQMPDVIRGYNQYVEPLKEQANVRLDFGAVI